LPVLKDKICLDVIKPYKTAAKPHNKIKICIVVIVGVLLEIFGSYVRIYEINQDFS
jgi:hypothetical protein